MFRTDVIYRVIVSPTEHFYATSTDGRTVQTHYSAKRARLHVGDLPHEIVSHERFEELTAA